MPNSQELRKSWEKAMRAFEGGTISHSHIANQFHIAGRVFGLATDWSLTMDVTASP